MRASLAFIAVCSDIGYDWEQQQIVLVSRSDQIGESGAKTIQNLPIPRVLAIVAEL